MGVRAFLAGFVVAGVVLFAISAAKADSEWAAPQPTATVQSTGQPEDQSSKNFPKTGRFLPGEEVVTPTGKKMRVWSTEGPVPVTQPTNPPAGYGVPYGTEVIVDQREPSRRRFRRGPTGDTSE